MENGPRGEGNGYHRSLSCGKLLMAFAIVAIVAVGCFVLMDADDSDAATSGSCGDTLTWSIDGEGNLTITGTGAMTDYEYWDTRWGGNTVTTVSLPAGLTSIGNSAFYGCTSLASVTIPDSVMTIGSKAFRGCTSLASVTIGDSVTSIGLEAFYRCSSLASVTIPDSVTTIDSDVFGACTLLASVTIGDSVTSIGSAAFAGCTSLSSITIPNSVTSIGEYAFYNCTSLAEVNVSCTNPLGITKGSEGNGYVAYYATTVNPIIHTYSATYEWAADGSSCTVHIVCANNSGHNHDVIATVNSSVKIPATCTEMGTTTYSVSGNYDGFAYSSTKDVVDIPVKGHAYSATYEWADNGSSCTVHIVCANNSGHNQDIVAESTSSVKIQPTATTKGTTEYSVSGTYDGFAYSDTKDVQDIPATGGSDSGNSDSNKKESPITYLSIVIVVVLALAILLIGRR